ncbi:hypothetical protein PGTUg99_029266 [Puccinia graminis f. sp. tritici]|uniref:Uncharacterized protein n=1 Tax=Puccinia graminis f. sp. tritici TaxID=56615 RepID=A0A5B0RUZ0_PUCGR|nr:hypothetical protein PGTUg99_029266 [Puccinia graminis f. sp. tritici]
MLLAELTESGIDEFSPSIRMNDSRIVAKPLGFKINGVRQNGCHIALSSNWNGSAVGRYATLRFWPKKRSVAALFLRQIFVVVSGVVAEFRYATLNANGNSAALRYTNRYG